MSFLLAVTIAMIFMVGGMELNVSPDFLLLTMAIIFAGGLAGCKD